MHANRLTAILGAVAVGIGVLTSGASGAEPAGQPLAPRSPALHETEFNAWPVVVKQSDSSGQVSQWTGAGPLAFGRMTPDGGSWGGVRPFWVQRRDAEGRFRYGTFLYPLFSYTVDQNTYHWNVFQLIRRGDRRSDAADAGGQYDTRGLFEVWPLWFSRQSGIPERDYRALFPVAGTVKNKLGFERARWVLFPLYFEAESRGATTTQTPWPVVRVTRGTARGFGIWPLFEWREEPGRWRRETYLWPFGYNRTTQPPADAAPGTPPTRDVGALPFYARRTAPGFIDESYLWPFFGYTDRTHPAAYRETRYFWPLFVQGRGDDRLVNRWGPFYTHSVVKGYDKTWYLWPVFRQATWNDGDLAVKRKQLLFVVYWSEKQRSIARPEAAAATLTHVWPLYSNWNNGAGREQFQLFSPLDVFFTGNEKIRAAWSPLFAVYRREQLAPGTTRNSVLWNAITWRSDAGAQSREFHIGPVFSVSSNATGKRVAIGNGLVAFRRGANGWKTLWFDFPPKAVKAAQPSR